MSRNSKNIEKMLKNDLEAIKTPHIEKILPANAATKRDVRKSRFRPALAIAAATLALLLVVGCGAAIPEILARLNSPKITDVTYRLTEVPEGWIGIYDYKDLLLFEREQNKNARFIFMNDIKIPDEAYGEGGIFEGGMEPLGIYRSETPLDVYENVKRDSCFCGEVNGNGYVISNLRLKAASYRAQADVSDMPLVAGLFGYGSVKVIHLGIEDVKISIELDEGREHSEVYVGVLAARAESVMGCYARNVEVYFSDGTQIAATKKENVYLGGLCGFASYVDSCFVEGASLSANISGEWENVMLGGISGTANACVTSYFEGDVSANKGAQANVYTDEICAMHYPAYIPRLLSGEAMDAIRENFIQAGMDEKSFYYQKFMSYYLIYDKEYWSEEGWRELAPKAFEYAENFYTLDTKVETETPEAWYVLDSAVSVDDLKKMTDVIIGTFDGDVSAMEQFFAQYNVKTGKLLCYGFKSGESDSINENSLCGFDFVHIWTTSPDGAVIQRIFTEDK